MHQAASMKRSGSFFFAGFCLFFEIFSFLLLIFPQIMDQPLHYLRVDGAFLILGKDVPSRFMVGELCGPLKNQGFQEGVNPFLLPETNLVIEEVPVLPGVLLSVVGPPVGDIPKEGEDGPLVTSSDHLEGVSISLPVDLLIFSFKDNPQDIFAHTVHGLPESLLKLLEIHPLL